MTIKTNTFTISSKGNNDVIEITSKIQDIIVTSNESDGLISIRTKGNSTALILMESKNELIEELIQTIEKITKTNIDTSIENLNLNNQIKALLLKNNLLINFKNKKLDIENKEKIYIIDFDYGANIREIITTIIN